MTRLAASADPRGEFPLAPPEYLSLMLTAITRYRDAQLERLLRPIGLTVAWHRAMLVLERFEPCTMTELAEFSIADRTTMTRIVDHLVSAGWVDRVTRPPDRRQVLLTLTEAGRAITAQSGRLVLQQNRIDLEGIPEESQRELIRLTQSLLANMAPDPEARERALTFRRPANAEGTD